MNPNVNIYGDKIYTDDSSICKAAVHATIIENKPN